MEERKIIKMTKKNNIEEYKSENEITNLKKNIDK